MKSMPSAFSQPPLIVLTRSREANERWRPRLEEHGYRVYPLDTIGTQLILPTERFAEVAGLLHACDWVVFTSASAVAYTRRILAERSHPPPPVSVAVVGERTSEMASQQGWTVAFRPRQATAAGLATELPIVTGQRVVWLGGAKADQAPMKVIHQRGGEVKSVIVYDTLAITGEDHVLSQELTRARAAAIVVASGTAAMALSGRLSQAAYDKALGTLVVALGPSARLVLERLGFRRIVMANAASLDGVLLALSQTE